MSEINEAPPQCLEAEMSIIGAMCFSVEAQKFVREYLTVSDFYAGPHRVMYQAIINMIEDGKNIDYVTLTEYLRVIGWMKDAGGIAYVTKVMRSSMPGENLMDHVEIVKNKSKFREIVGSSTELIQRCHKTDKPEKLDQMLVQMRSVVEPMVKPKEDKAERLRKSREDMRKGIRKGISTGLKSLDKRLAGGGWVPGRLYVFGAYTSHGKSSFGLDQACRVDVGDGGPVLYANLEMPQEEMDNRQRSIISGIPYFDIGYGMERAWWDAIERADELIPTLPLEIVTKPNLSPDAIWAIAKRVKPSMIVIDYLQRMDLMQMKNETRELAVSRGAVTCKNMALDMMCPVILFSQLNRENENKNKPPRVNDLRESGAIGNEADLVGLIWNQNKVMGKGKHGQVMFNIDKQRGGPTCKFWLGYDAPTSRFYDMPIGEDMYLGR